MSAVLAPNILLRTILPEDLPAIIEIEQAAYSHPWSLKIFEDCLQVGYTTCLLELDDYIVGYGLMSVGAQEAHILNLCVHPNFQRCGYGRSLLKQLLNLARQQQVNTVFLDVRPSNYAALTLYYQIGFNQIGHRKNYYPNGKRGREDALIFALEL
jgi:ribosomal-protein-alanine N-acetyltransferase